jgi:acetyl esterase/lipase
VALAVAATAVLAAGYHFRPRSGLLAAIQPTSGVQAFRDIAYGGETRDRLDVYAPKTRRSEGRPVVVFFYGGEWTSGSRVNFGWMGVALARQGYVVIVPDYRVYPEVMWPVFVQDNARAVRWAHDHARDYGGDPRRMVVMGHSAGATNAFHLALDPQWLRAVGLDPRRDLRGAVSLGGFLTFRTPPGEQPQLAFGRMADTPVVEPITYVSADDPPLFLGVGGLDREVDPLDSKRLAAKARSLGVEATFVRYPYLNHRWLLKVLSDRLQWIAPTMRDVSGFIDAHTSPETAPDATATRR